MRSCRRTNRFRSPFIRSRSARAYAVFGRRAQPIARNAARRLGPVEPGESGHGCAPFLPQVHTSAQPGCAVQTIGINHQTQYSRAVAELVVSSGESPGSGKQGATIVDVPNIFLSRSGRRQRRGVHLGMPEISLAEARTAGEELALPRSSRSRKLPSSPGSRRSRSSGKSRRATSPRVLVWASRCGSGGTSTSWS